MAAEPSSPVRRDSGLSQHKPPSPPCSTTPGEAPGPLTRRPPAAHRARATALVPPAVRRRCRAATRALLAGLPPKRLPKVPLVLLHRPAARRSVAIAVDRCRPAISAAPLLPPCRASPPLAISGESPGPATTPAAAPWSARPPSRVSPCRRAALVAGDLRFCRARAHPLFRCHRQVGPGDLPLFPEFNPSEQLFL
jgi:hypothetical protein